ncbi:MAG TPA: hypothetical protein V6D43_18465 [Candidatus Sericytochromatia bacterium]
MAQTFKFTKLSNFGNDSLTRLAIDTPNRVLAIAFAEAAMEKTFTSN